MENNQRQILSEIHEIAASIRTQLEILEKKIEELSQVSDNEDVDAVIDLDMIASPVEKVINTSIVEPVQEEDIPAEEDTDLPPLEEVVPLEEDMSQQASEEDIPAEEDTDLPPLEEVIPVEEDTDLPFVEEPEQVVKEVIKPEVHKVIEENKTTDEIAVNDYAAAHHKVAVIDKMAEHQAWRVDMPGSPVRDVRSAISLNDRLLFINTLFSRDPMLFQDTINIINAMDSLDEAVEYLSANFTLWNFESDEVYRFMMAVRRRLK